MTLSVDSTEYIGDFVFENNVFKQYHFDGGYITGSGSPTQYKYYIKDHLGNNRAVVSNAGTVQQKTEYYPYGAIHHFSTNQDVQKYKYNGKELDTMHGLNWYDYGARQYDPAIAQFTTVDPLCEKYYHISPYAYCGGNPVNRVDPDGRDGVPIIDEENKIITIKANYYVVTDNESSKCKGYNLGDIEEMNAMVRKLNNHNFKISKGQYKDYTVKFDVKFIDGGNKNESLQQMYEDVYHVGADGPDVPFGNILMRNDSDSNTHLKDKDSYTHIGGYAQSNLIVMNNGIDADGNKLDNQKTRLHEVFHTFGFSDFQNKNGIMDYNSLRINRRDIDSLLPTLQKFNQEKYGLH